MYITNYENYLMHHGVKGMKWGVRHDPIPTGRSARRSRVKALRSSKPRYTSFSDRPISGRKARKQRVKEEIKSIGRKEDAQAYKYNKANESGYKGLARKVSANLDSTYGKISPKQKYSKPSSFFKKAGKNVVQNYKDGADFYKKSFNSIKNKKPKEIGKHYVDWLNQDVEVLGFTGSKKMKRGRYISGVYNPFY